MGRHEKIQLMDASKDNEHTEHGVYVCVCVGGSGQSRWLLQPHNCSHHLSFFNHSQKLL